MSKSVLLKMAETQIDTTTLLGNTYQDLLNKIDIKKKDMYIEKKQAKQLEDFLSAIKHVQLTGRNDITRNQQNRFSKFWSNAALGGLITELKKANPNLFSQGYFIANQEIQNATSEQLPNILGKNLEEGLDQVIKTFVKTIDKSNSISKEKNYQVGGYHIQVPDLFNEIKEDERKLFNQFYKMTQDNLYQYNQVKDKTGNIKKASNSMSSVQGKIDVVGLTGNINIAVQSKIKKDILNCLKDATFTAKNYLSTSEIHLGKTNPFRVFMSVVYNNSSIEKISSFSRMLQCFKSHSKHKLAVNYFYRIRAIYELMGSENTGYVNKTYKYLNGMTAKFLVYNNPTGAIKVIPTKEIARKLFEQTAKELKATDWQEAMYGPITIKATNLLNF